MRSSCTGFLAKCIFSSTFITSNSNILSNTLKTLGSAQRGFTYVLFWSMKVLALLGVQAADILVLCLPDASPSKEEILFNTQIPSRSPALSVASLD